MPPRFSAYARAAALLTAFCSVDEFIRPRSRTSTIRITSVGHSELLFTHICLGSRTGSHHRLAESSFVNRK